MMRLLGLASQLGYSCTSQRPQWTRAGEAMTGVRVIGIPGALAQLFEEFL